MIKLLNAKIKKSKVNGSRVEVEFGARTLNRTIGTAGQLGMDYRVDQQKSTILGPSKLLQL